MAWSTSGSDAEEFAQVVAHDLRGPLRVIEGFSTILLEAHAEGLDAEGRRILDVLRDEARKASRRLDGLREWSRSGRAVMQPRTLDMRQLADVAFREAREREPGREVTVRLGALPAANGDEPLIGRVWAELASNAVKFTRGRAAAHVHVEAREEGDEVVYTVQDDGVGFDTRYRDKLFGVSQRLHSDDEFEGAGMGLAIVRRIVERHGGRVGAEVLPAGGAAFWFSLPKGAAS